MTSRSATGPWSIVRRWVAARRSAIALTSSTRRSRPARSSPRARSISTAGSWGRWSGELLHRGQEGLESYSVANRENPRAEVPADGCRDGLPWPGRVPPRVPQIGAAPTGHRDRAAATGSLTRQVDLLIFLSGRLLK